MINRTQNGQLIKVAYHKKKKPGVFNQKMIIFNSRTTHTFDRAGVSGKVKHSSNWLQLNS